jgi:hypothetical protein
VLFLLLCGSILGITTGFLVDFEESVRTIFEQRVGGFGKNAFGGYGNLSPGLSLIPRCTRFLG